MPLEIIREDITTMETDAIVNAANTALEMGGGVCGAIFKAAGISKLQAACRQLGDTPTGTSVITEGYGLPARYIIHTVGPIWQGGTKGEPELLHRSYTSALTLAEEYQLQSIAFPLISSGIYGYPKREALQIAVAAITEFLVHSDMMVYLLVFDEDSFVISRQLFTSIETYIDEHYVAARTPPRRLLEHELDLQESHTYDLHRPLSHKPRRLDDVVRQLGESFSEMLLRCIDEKGLTDVEVYKRANLDRRLFSKIRVDDNYNPSKPTALALAIALQLSLDETKDLLSKAGYALSHSHKMDLIIEYFIVEGNYNIYDINEALFAFEQPLLGAGTNCRS